MGDNQGINAKFKQQKSMDQRLFSDIKKIVATVLFFEPNISSDQGRFLPIKILDPVCKCFYRQRVTTPCGVSLSK